MESNLDTMNELNALRAFFTTAQTQLRAGQIMDMTGIDVRIAAVCQAVQQAPQKQQQVFLPELSILIELLGTYELELRNLQAALANKIKENSSDDDKS